MQISGVRVEAAAPEYTQCRVSCLHPKAVRRTLALLQRPRPQARSEQTREGARLLFGALSACGHGTDTAIDSQAVSVP